MRRSIFDITSERLSVYIKEKGLRQSPLRLTVLARICQMPQPFSAEALALACEEERVSLATMYNTLKLFADANIVHVLERERGQRTTTLYEVVDSQARMQFVCEKCGRISSVHDKAIERIVYAHKSPRFSFRQFTLFMYGECKKCKEKSKRFKKK